MRRFEEVNEERRKFPDVETKLPERADGGSAGYDFFSKEHITIFPGESHLFWTDVCATMFRDNVLQIYTRSGNGVNKGLILRNNVGIIDSSYYPNNIGICLINTGLLPIEIKIGDKIAQGVFYRYLICDDDKFLLGAKSERTGGFGSTGE